MVSVKWSEFVDAFEFASCGDGSETSAFVDLQTGTIYCSADGLDDEGPEDLHTSDRYVSVPHKNDLDLGRSLALAFVEQHLPEDLRQAVDFFAKRGAYSRFKQLLASRDALTAWHAFEAEATEQALKAWCEEHEIQLVFDQPPATP